MRRQTLLKIAGLMRKEIDKGLTILEISRKLQIGYRPAYNHISAMEKEGIITVERVGSAKLCFLNLPNARCRFILEESDLERKEDIYKKYPKIKVVIEGIISRLAKEFVSGIQSVILFGSYAKGTAGKASDIDILFIVCDLKDRQLREGIEQECRSYQYSHNIQVSPLISDMGEFKKMLEAEGLNVGKEARQYGISLYGSEMFWRAVS